MINRIETIESALNVTLPNQYREFINEIGIISDERGEVYGYIEGIDTNEIPCVIGATQKYSSTNTQITTADIVIAFDDYLNSPVILHTESGEILIIDINGNRHHKAGSFDEWFCGLTGDH